MTQQKISTKLSDDEIDLRELFNIVWNGKWIIIATTFIFTIASVFYSLSLPNVYKSDALLAPAAEQKSSGLSGQLGGLAALAGVTLGGGASIDKTILAIEIIKSREFVEYFVRHHIFLPDLMAVKNWDIETNTLEYDASLYSAERQIWVRDVKPPRKAEPSAQEAYTVFSELLEITQDKSTGMVKISIEHVSPYIAQTWLSKLVVEINQKMKLRDIEEAEKSIEYLESQITKTNVSDVKAALFSLVEEQTKTLMLANVRDEYVFKIVDPAIVPELKSKPRRAVIVAIATVMSAMLSIFAVLFMSLFRKPNRI